MEELTVSVDVAVPPDPRSRLVGLTDAVSPDPAETVRETVPEKPPMLVVVMVAVPDEPGSMLIVDVFDAMLKSADCETVTVSETEWDRLPLDPVTRIVYVPGVVDAEVVIVRVDVAELPEDNVRLVLLKETTGGLAVAGDRPFVRATVPLKPFRLVTGIEELALAPGNIVSELGFAAMEKSVALLTETCRVVECEIDPPVPVIVTV